MVAVNSTMLPLGTRLPRFELPDTEGLVVTSDSFSGASGLVVAFLCNHCPYVKHLQTALARIAREYQPRGIRFVGINANDVARYPADSPEKMKAEAQNAGYVFPYLYDESQNVAKTFRAACTPDFYLFDQEQRLVYRGQFDDSRPGNGLPATGQNLQSALDAVLSGQSIPAEQKPSIGCNIKWKPGNEPEWFA